MPLTVSRLTVVATLLRRMLRDSPPTISKPDVRNEKKPPQFNGAAFEYSVVEGLALTCLEARLCFVDHVNAAFAANDTAVAVTVLQRPERVLDFHKSVSCFSGARSRHSSYVCFKG